VILQLGFNPLTNGLQPLAINGPYWVVYASLGDTS
jgi:hypothetical protein